MQDWEQCCQNVPCVPQHRMVQTFHRSKLLKYVLNVIQNWETDALQFYAMVLIFCSQIW